MRFYRLEYCSHIDSSQGFEWLTSKVEVARAARKWEEGSSGDHFTELTTVDIEPTKQGILKVLNLYASHPNNG